MGTPAKKATETDNQQQQWLDVSSIDNVRAGSLASHPGDPSNLAGSSSSMDERDGDNQEQSDKKGKLPARNSLSNASKYGTDADRTTDPNIMSDWNPPNRMPSSFSRRGPQHLQRRNFQSGPPVYVNSSEARFSDVQVKLPRRASYNSNRSSRSTHYPVVITGNPTSLPAVIDATSRAENLASDSSFTQESSTFAPSTVSSRHYDISRSSSNVTPPATPLSAIGSRESAIAENENYISRVLSYSAQNYREKLRAEREPRKPSVHLEIPMSASSSFNNISDNSQIGKSQPLAKGSLSTDAETPLSANPNVPINNNPVKETAASSDTLLRALRCKQYLETRYENVGHLTDEFRYNPLEIIRWRRTMWAKAVTAGASSEEQKKWKLRYYTWHVGNSEVSEFINEKRAEKEAASRKGIRLDSVAKREVNNIRARKFGNRWRNARKRGSWELDEGTEGSASDHDRPMGRGDKIKRRLKGKAWASRTSSEGSRGLGINGEHMDGENGDLQSPNSQEQLEGNEEPTLLALFLGRSNDGINKPSVSSENKGEELRSVGSLDLMHHPDTSIYSPSAQTTPRVSGDAENTPAERFGMQLDAREDVYTFPSSPPVRKRSKLWSRILDNKRGAENNNDSARMQESAPSPKVEKRRKKSFLHAVSIDHLGNRLRGSAAGLSNRSSSESNRQIEAVESGSRVRESSPLKYAVNPDGSKRTSLDASQRASFDVSDPMLRDSNDMLLVEKDAATASNNASQNVYRKSDEMLSQDGMFLQIGHGAKNLSVRADGILEENGVSETDDEEGRAGARGFKGMMKNIGRRKRRDTDGPDEDRANLGDFAPEADPRGQLANAAAWTDDRGMGDAIRKKGRDLKQKFSLDPNRRWLWDENSSEESSDAQGGTTTNLANSRDPREQWWTRPKRKKIGSLEHEVMVARTASDPSEPASMARRKQRIITLIGARLNNDSSASLATSSAGEGNETVGVAPFGSQSFPSDRFKDTSGNTSEPFSTMLSPSSGDVNTEMSMSAVGLPSSRRTRSLSTPFTTEENRLQSRCAALGILLDRLSPMTERLSQEVKALLTRQETFTVQEMHNVTNTLSHLSEASETHSASSVAYRTNDASVGTTLTTAGWKSVSTGLLVEKVLPAQLDDGSVADTALSSWHDTHNRIARLLTQAQTCLSEMESTCQDISERDKSSHEHMSQMVKHLDGLNQKVNEDHARQIKQVEEQLRLRDGHPRAMGWFQEMYYQLIAYVLGFLGFMFWLWFRCWKWGRWTINSGRTLLLSNGAKANL